MEKKCAGRSDLGKSCSGINFVYSILFTVIIVCLAGCSPKTDLKPGETAELTKETLPVGQIAYPFDLFTEYLIAPGDVLDILFQIQTWLEKERFLLAVDQVISVKFENTPELDVTQTIRPDGSISLPFIGKIHVTGETVEDLTADLKDRYKEVLQIPNLYIIVSEFRSAIKELKKDLHTAPRGLSRLVTVRPDGFVTFPMVGDVFVAGKPVPEVNQILNDKYAQVVEGLHCDLFLEKHSGSMVYVIGQVNKPGAYKIKRPINVLQALTLAGSYDYGANLESVIIARKHEGKMIATRVDLTQTISAAGGSHFTYLQPEDIVYVPRTWISEAAEVAEYLKSIALFRGWGFNFSWELHKIKE
ncbi:MAG: sugar transporter [Bacteroidetes bacterium]|nr:sugar transporter [Bacteroidota bacterium]